MHFVRGQLRLNRATGIEVFIWLMSYELQGCQLVKTPKMECSSDPLKVRETGNDFGMKIRRDEPIYLPRSLRGLQQEMPQSRIFMLLLPPHNRHSRCHPNHLPSLASIPHLGGWEVMG